MPVTEVAVWYTAVLVYGKYTGGVVGGEQEKTRSGLLGGQQGASCASTITAQLALCARHFLVVLGCAQLACWFRLVAWAGTSYLTLRLLEPLFLVGTTVPFTSSAIGIRFIFKIGKVRIAQGQGLLAHWDSIH